MKIYVMKYLLALVLFTAISCEEMNTNPTFSIGKESAFQINKLDYSADGQYTLLIKEISDSRCPEGVECIWSGEVLLKGEWTYNGTTTLIELHSVLKDLQKEPEGFSIQIVDAKPYPKNGIETKPEDLVITLLAQKK
jgi:hypothetical protein